MCADAEFKPSLWLATGAGRKRKESPSSPVRKNLPKNKVYSYTQIHTLKPTLGAGKNSNLGPICLPGSSSLGFLKSVTLEAYSAPTSPTVGVPTLLCQTGRAQRSSRGASVQFGTGGKRLCLRACAPWDGQCPQLPSPASEAERGKKFSKPIHPLQSPGDSVHSLGSGELKSGVQLAILSLACRCARWGGPPMATASTPQSAL